MPSHTIVERPELWTLEPRALIVEHRATSVDRRSQHGQVFLDLTGGHKSIVVVTSEPKHMMTSGRILEGELCFVGKACGMWIYLVEAQLVSPKRLARCTSTGYLSKAELLSIRQDYRSLR
jgi:hypothetical protein